MDIDDLPPRSSGRRHRRRPLQSQRRPGRTRRRVEWVLAALVVAAALATPIISTEPTHTASIDRANLELAAAIASHEQATERWHEASRSARELAEEHRRIAEARDHAARRFHDAAINAAADRTSVRLSDGLPQATATPDEVVAHRDTYRSLQLRAERIDEHHRQELDRSSNERDRHGQAVLLAARTEQQAQQVESRIEQASRTHLALEQVRTLANPPESHPEPPFMWPADGVVASGYGLRAIPDFGRMHPGIDIANLPGTPIRAAAAGEVVAVRHHSGLGNAIVIDHGEQPQHPGRWTTVYSHLDAMAVTRGQQVRAGEKIGSLGNSGEMSTGPHLHFEVRIENQPVDPRRWLGSRSVDDAQLARER